MGDDETAKLAASIRADEEEMLDRVLRELPRLTDAVVRAEVEGDSSFDASTTGAADAARDARDSATKAARTTGKQAKRNARQARKVPGVTRAEGQVKGALASESDLAIARYDSLTADEISGKLAALSQIDLAKVEAYERKNQNRTTVLSPHHDPARRRAVDRLRRADRRRGAGRARRGRQRSRRPGPLLRAQPQEPRGCPRGRGQDLANA